MEDIKAWLTSEMDYKQGVELFAKYCPNKMYVRNFRRGNADTNVRKLEYEMKRLLGIPLEVITSQRCSNQQLINHELEIGNYKPIHKNSQQTNGLTDNQIKKKLQMLRNCVTILKQKLHSFTVNCMIWAIGMTKKQ